MKKILFLLFLVMSGHYSMYAQSTAYAVNLTTVCAPPYPLSLDGFVAEGNSKINLNFNISGEVNNLPIKLKMTLTSGSVTLTTDPAFVPAPIILNTGEIPMLDATDLEPYFNPKNLIFSGYSKTQYQKTGTLPEGVYTIKFEPIHYYLNRIIGRAVPAIIFLSMSEAPILNLPVNGATINATGIQNIIFNWSPRNSPFASPTFIASYKFELWDVIPEALDPNQIVRSSRPIFSTDCNSSTFAYTTAEPILIPGHKYAWRIQVIDPDNKVQFRNNGYSDVRWFKYGINCPVPALKSDGATTSDITISWDAGTVGNFTYELQYKQASKKWSEAYTKQSTFLSEKISQLKTNTPYDFQVRCLCSGQTGDFSEPLTVSTTINKSFECGSTPTPPDLSNVKMLQKLTAGDYIKAGDFQVQVYECTGSGGTFSGKGFILVPFLNFLKIEASFSGIKVNEDYQMVDGEIASIYNMANSMTFTLGDLNNLISNNRAVEEENPFEDIADRKVETGATIRSFTVQSDGTVLVTDVNGTTTTIPPPSSTGAGNAPQTVAGVSEDGEQYVADVKEKKVYSGVPDSRNRATGTPVTSETNKSFSVNFAAHPLMQFGLDLPVANSPAGMYQEIFIGGSKYLIPYKSIESGRIDKAVAVVSGSPIDSVKYMRQSNNMVMTAPGDKANEKYLLLSGLSDMDEDQLMAWYPSDTGAKATRVLAGQLNMTTYDKKIINLTIVPVNGSLCPEATVIENELNKIYAQAVVRFVVTKAKNFEVTLAAGKVKNIDNTDADSRMNYTADMNSVISAFKDNDQYTKDSYYLFFFDGAKDASKNGYMPLKKQFGFIFHYIAGPDGNRTVAHELGHGPFRLYHTFSDNNKYKLSQGTTDNLMDYSSATALALNKYQWDWIHDPGWRFYGFEDEEEAEEARVSDIQKLYDCCSNNSTLSFLTPAGEVISLKGKIDYVSFATPGDDWVYKETGEKSPHAFPLGTLKRFKVENHLYEPRGTLVNNGDLIFKGYFCEETKQFYDDIYTKDLTSITSLIGFVCFENGSFKVNIHTSNEYSKAINTSLQEPVGVQQIPITQLLDKYDGVDFRQVEESTSPFLLENNNSSSEYSLTNLSPNLSTQEEFNGNGQATIDANLSVEFANNFRSYLSFLGVKACCDYDLYLHLKAAYLLTRNINFLDCLPELKEKLSTYVLFSNYHIEDFARGEHDDKLPVNTEMEKKVFYLSSLVDGLDELNKAFVSFDYNGGTINSVVELTNNLDEAIQGCFIKKIPLNIKKLILQNHNNKTFTWSDFTTTKEKILADILFYSTSEEQSEIITLLSNNNYKLFWSIYNDINGENSEYFIATIASILTRKSDFASKKQLLLNVKEPEVEDISTKVIGIYKTSLLDELTFEANSSTYLNSKKSGDIYIINDKLLGHNYTFINNPFEIVKILVKDDFRFYIEGKKLRESDILYMPAIVAYNILNRQNTVTAWAMGRIFMDAGAIVLTAGAATPEVIAVEMTMTGIDIALTLTEEQVQSSNNQTLIEYHNTVNNITGIISLGIAIPSTVKGIIKVSKKFTTKLSKINFTRLKSAGTVEINSLKNSIENVGKLDKSIASINKAAGVTNSLDEEAELIFKSAENFKKCAVKINPKVGSTSLGYEKMVDGEFLFVDENIVARVNTNSAGIVEMDNLVFTSTLENTDELFALEDIAYKVSGKAEKGNLKIVKNKVTGKIFSYIVKAEDEILDVLAKGIKIDDLSKAPAGYEIYTVKNSKYIRRLDITNPNTPRVTINENGIIVKYTGPARISSSQKFIKNLEDAYGSLPLNHQRHHLVPDNVVRNSPLHQEAIKRGLYDIDRASNGRYLAETAEDFSEASKEFPTHLGSHPNYDVSITNEINKVLQTNGVNPNSISSLTDIQITNMLDDIEDNALNVLENWIPSSLK